MQSSHQGFGDSPAARKHNEKLTSDKSIASKATILIAIVGAIVEFTALCVLVVSLAVPSRMPNVEGLSVADACAEIGSIAANPLFVFTDEDGNQVDIDTVSDANLIDVKCSAPEAEARISRLAPYVIKLTCGIREDVIQQAAEDAKKQEGERLAAESAKRKGIAEKEIAGSLENGWASEEYEDGGSYLLFRIYDSDPAIDFDLWSFLSDYSRNDYSGRFKTMAEEAEATIIAAFFTADGYLFNLCVEPYSNSSKEDAEQALGVAKDISREAESFSTQNRESYLDALVASHQEIYDEYASIEYSIFGNEVIVYWYADYNGELHWEGTPSELEENYRKRYIFAREISMFANADTVTLKFFSRDGVPFANGDSVTYTRDSSTSDLQF